MMRAVPRLSVRNDGSNLDHEGLVYDLGTPLEPRTSTAALLDRDIQLDGFSGKTDDIDTSNNTSDSADDQTAPEESILGTADHPTACSFASHGEGAFQQVSTEARTPARPPSSVGEEYTASTAPPSYHSECETATYKWILVPVPTDDPRSTPGLPFAVESPALLPGPEA